MAGRQRVRRGREGDHAGRTQGVRQGADSAFFAIERKLIAAGHERNTGESTTSWIRRLAESGVLADTAELLRDILPLHYRYRFHPAGLDQDGRRALAAHAQRWLAKNQAESS